MKKTTLKRLLSYIVCSVLIAAVALFTTGCNDKETPSLPDSSRDETITSSVDKSSQNENTTDVKVLGEGATVFNFTVTDVNGTETAFEIHTDKTKVGEALQGLGVIDGEEGPYGLYVKTVNGTTLDYDKDGKYWAFYINGEYGTTGADVTEIESGATYSFKAE